MPAFLKKNPKKFLLIIALLLIGLSFPKTVYGLFPLATVAASGILIAVILLFQQLLVILFSLLVTAFVGLVGLDLRVLMGLGVGSAVDTVWRLVRDLSNMFFIVVMVMIAFATMLKLEQYKWQRLLPKLVIMAILINFSKTISLIILDFGQLLMMTFVRAFKDIAVDNLITGLKLGDMFTMAKSVRSGWDATKLLIAPLLSIIMIAVATIVMLTLVVILLSRMVILWVLIAISPAAYLTNVLDATKQYWSKWWSFFIKTVFLGPTLAFFLWFVFLFMNGANNILPQDQFEKSLPGLDPDLGYASNAASSPLSFTNFLIAIILLTVGTGMAISAAGASGKAAGAVKGMASGWTRGRISDWARESEGKGLLRSTVGKLPLPGGYLGKKLGREYKGQTFADKMGPKLAERWEGSPNKLARFTSRMLKKKPIKGAVGYLADRGRNRYEVGNFDVREETDPKDGTVKLVVTAKDFGTFRHFQSVKDSQKDNPEAWEELKKRFVKSQGYSEEDIKNGKVRDVEFREKGAKMSPAEKKLEGLHTSKVADKGNEDVAGTKKPEAESDKEPEPTTPQDSKSSEDLESPHPSGEKGPATLAGANQIGESLQKTLNVHPDQLKGEMQKLAKSIKDIKVINKGREGYTAKTTEGHERIERKLELRRARNQEITQMRMMQALNKMQNYKGASGEKAQEKLIQETRAQFNITGNSPEDNERATKEAFIGALLNSATHWGDKDGAKLSQEDVEEFRDLTRSD